MHKNIPLVVGITILFLGTCITPTVAIDNVKKTSILISYSNTLYVGGSGENNYTKIQDAIDNASDGDTVFVYNGTYYENIEVDKSINLIGEILYSTSIYGNNSGDVIHITNNVNGGTIEGFQIHNSGNNEWEDAGIEINGYFDSISGNLIINNWIGIFNPKSWSDHYGYCDKISNNIITGNEVGICIDSTDETLSKTDIYGNLIENNSRGIYVSYHINYYHWDSDNRNNIYQNLITNNIYGILIFNEHYQDVYHNNITQNKYGVVMSSVHGNCYQNNIFENNIERNQYGIRLTNSCTSDTSDNSIYLNNLKDNNCGVIITSDIYGFCPYNNNIYQNNFINNDISAKIEPDEKLWSRFSSNIWENNYWNRSRILPKMVTSPYLITSLFNIDWRPALKPYDI